MRMKWIGALCVIIGCGGWGFSMAVQHLNRIRFLKNLLSVLDYMNVSCSTVQHHSRNCADKQGSGQREYLDLYFYL